MIIKLGRESILVMVSALMVLIGLFYYGNELLVKPLANNVDEISANYEQQQSLVEEYPPNKKLLKEYEQQYIEAERFIPFNVQANQALISLESLANQTGVSVLSLSRITEGEILEEFDKFAKDTYTVQLRASSPNDLRNLIKLLIEQERIWNVSSFAYSKSNDEEYAANLNFELYYRKNHTTE